MIEKAFRRSFFRTRLIYVPTTPVKLAGRPTVPKKYMFLWLSSQRPRHVRVTNSYTCVPARLSENADLLRFRLFCARRLFRKFTFPSIDKTEIWRTNEHDYLYLCWESQPFVSGEFTETGRCLSAPYLKVFKNKGMTVVFLKIISSVTVIFFSISFWNTRS